MKLENKSIDLPDGVTIKIGEPLFYMPLSTVMYLEACNRERLAVKVSEFSFIQSTAFFRKATDEEILKCL